jgi:hypothetical protein
VEKMEVKTFLMEKKINYIKRLEDRPSAYNDNFEVCWEILEKSMVKNHSSVNPKFVRRLEVLEALMFGFLESASDLNSLDFAEKTIFSLGK